MNINDVSAFMAILQPKRTARAVGMASRAVLPGTQPAATGVTRGGIQVVSRADAVAVAAQLARAQRENAVLRQENAQLRALLSRAPRREHAAPRAPAAPTTAPSTQPAAQAVIEVPPASAAPAEKAKAAPISAEDKIFYGEALRGDHPWDFADLDSDLGLEG